MKRSDLLLGARLALHSFATVLLDLLYVPKCVSCNRILSKEERVFCGECSALYREEKQRICSRCFSPRERCVCAPSALEKNGLSRLVKLYRYHPGQNECPSNDIIYRLKRDHLRSVFDFLVEELVSASVATVERIGTYTVVYAPRSRTAIARYGYDHMRILAEKFAKHLGLSFACAIRRRKGGAAQKKLSGAERKRNAENLFYPSASVDLKGKSVLLLDDIVTSGSTINACADVLRKMGAKRIVCVCIAVSGRDSPLPPKRYSVKMHKRLDKMTEG